VQETGLPAKIPRVWGVSAAPPYITTIPTNSQIGITNGRASFADGFVPLNFQPISAGGVPPFGADFNGILNQITGGLQALQGGPTLAYDGTFSAAIGGYRKDAIVESATTDGVYWRSTVDNNTSNPDTGGANWEHFSGPKTLVAVGGYLWVGGVLVQWGQGSCAGGNPAVITFPIAFPTQVFGALATDRAASSWSSINSTFYGAQVTSNTQMTVVAANWNGSGVQVAGGGLDRNFFYVALGN
jgi:hypothetical protein